MKVVVFLIGLVLGTAPVPASKLPPTQPDGDLPPIARSLLSQRMEGHAVSATELLWAVVFLEHEETARIARDLAEEPRIARPLPGVTDELNARLPPRFFELQDGFAKRAAALADAADEGDGDEVATRYGELTRACIACHTAYLEVSPR